MRITADTNVLVRAAVGDHPRQAELAAAVLRNAEIVAVTLPTLCEFVWVLGRGYRRQAVEIAEAIRVLVKSEAIRANRSAIEAGLAMLEGGGDFADGVIAFEGQRLGGPVFTSFDRRAVELITAVGGQTHLLPET